VPLPLPPLLDVPLALLPPPLDPAPPPKPVVGDDELHPATPAGPAQPSTAAVITEATRRRRIGFSDLLSWTRGRARGARRSSWRGGRWHRARCPTPSSSSASRANRLSLSRKSYVFAVPRLGAAYAVTTPLKPRWLSEKGSLVRARSFFARRRRGGTSSAHAGFESELFPTCRGFSGERAYRQGLAARARPDRVLGPVGRTVRYSLGLGSHLVRRLGYEFLHAEARTPLARSAPRPQGGVAFRSPRTDGCRRGLFTFRDDASRDGHRLT
jgi:hypothetical protein